MVADLVLQTLRHALSVLPAERIPAAVMGGIAAAFWDLTRSTRDVDVLVAVNPAELEPVIEAFSGEKPPWPT